MLASTHGRAIDLSIIGLKLHFRLSLAVAVGLSSQRRFSGRLTDLTLFLSGNLYTRLDAEARLI